MKIVKIISLLGTAAMTAVLIFAFSTGDFFADGTKLIALPWGIVSLIDLYVGFILFSVWIVYREASLPIALVWVFFMLTLGFFTGTLYMFVAASTSQNQWKKFWLGKHADA